MKYSENLLNIGLISKKRSYNLQKKPVGVPFIAVKTSKSRRRYSSCYVCSLIRKLYFLRINILLGKNRKKQKWGCCIQRRPQKSIVIIKIGISIILRFSAAKNLTVRRTLVRLRARSNAVKNAFDVGFSVLYLNSIRPKEGVSQSNTLFSSSNRKFLDFLIAKKSFYWSASQRNDSHDSDFFI